MPSSSFPRKRFWLSSTPSPFRASLFAAALGIAAVMMAPSAASAQAVDQAVPGYALKRWSMADGLPHSHIVSMLQTRDGYLWLGTNAGLVRFDGLTFTTFNILNTPSLGSNAIEALHEDARGTLWIGSGATLVRYRDGIFAREPFADDTAPGAIADVRSDDEGKLWVAGQDRVIRREDDRWTVITPARTAFQPLFPTSDGTMWIATSKGLLEWRGRVVRTLTVDDGLPSEAVYTVRQDRRGRVWIGTERGLAYLDSRAPNARVERSTAATAAVTALLEDRNGALWIGGNEGLLVRSAAGALEGPFARGADDASSAVVAIAEDREGQIWFGIAGGAGGLYRLTRHRVTTLTHQYGLPCDNVGPITQAPDGTIWLASLCGGGGGVVAVRDGRPARYEGPAYVQSLLAEADGTVWAGTFGGELFRLTRGRFVEVPVPTRDAEEDIVAIYRHPDGALWLGTSNGLLRLDDGGHWRRIRSTDGLVGDDVRALSGDDRGALWIGTTSGLSRYDEGRFTGYRTSDGVPPGAVRAIYIDSDEAVWIGTYGGGLARLAKGIITAFGDQGGLLDPSVHRILEDESGHLWLTGDRGVRRVSKRDLNAIADGATVSLEVDPYDEGDGMLNAECNGMGQPAGWRMRDGAFQFPTQRGVVRIDPSTAAVPSQPTPVPDIQQLIVDGLQTRTGAEALVAPGYEDIEVRYTAPALSRPDHVRFRYRVDGYSQNWSEVGTRRGASFVNLRPGRYRLLVSARHVGGAWSEPATLALVLQPFVYQRASFQIVLAMLAAVLGGVAVRWYARRLRHRAAALERAVAERTTELSVARDNLSAAHDRLAGTNADLVNAKQQVEQAHGRLLAVFDQLDIGVLVLSATGVVRYASALAQRVLRKDDSALLGHTWSACLPLLDSDRAQVLRRVERHAGAHGRVPVQMLVGGTRYWLEIDVRDEPVPGDGLILYMYNVAEVSAQPDSDRGAHGLVGRSTAIRVVRDQIGDVARVDTTILIQGETGTGKELVARAIHRESRRANRPFVAVNAAGLSESLLASQLFGHRRGAFTGAVDDQMGVFEAANGGTLFLDEVGDMPPSVQVSLLRVLQEREIVRLGDSQPRRVDVRFLAATHRDLAHEVAAGRFREDLLYRIRVATLSVPPLRDRIDDVPLLVNTFLMQAAGDEGRRPLQVSRPAMEALMRYRWPGNVRELKSLVERALVHAEDDVIHLDDLPIEVVSDRGAPLEGNRLPRAASERERVIAALRQSGGNRKEAARLLGIGRTTLYRRLVEYGIEQDDRS